MTGAWERLPEEVSFEQRPKQYTEVNETNSVCVVVILGWKGSGGELEQGEGEIGKSVEMTKDQHGGRLKSLEEGG